MNIFSVFFKKKNNSSTLDDMWEEKKKFEDMSLDQMIQTPGRMNLGPLDNIDHNASIPSDNVIDKISTPNGNLPWLFTHELPSYLEEFGIVVDITPDKKSVIIDTNVFTLPKVTRQITPSFLTLLYENYDSNKFSNINLELCENVIIITATDSAGNIFYA